MNTNTNLNKNQTHSGPGGKRPGAGRKAGSRNRKTSEMLAAVASKGVTPLDYLLSVMRDANAPPTVRIDAAKGAAPYCHAKLVSVDATVDQSVRVEIVKL